VFVLLELSGHSAPEAAEALGVPVNTVYSRLRIARQKFTAAVTRIRARETRA
jgi:RNA polymerase sigma-70 factor (ECF subfamily)